MKRAALSLQFLFYFSITVFSQHPDLGLHGQVTWLSDTKIRVEYDWSDDSQLSDWFTTNGSILVRGNNFVTITGGVASVRSMVWKQLIKCTRIYSQDAKAINATNAHLNFVTNVIGWTGLDFNPQETIGIIHNANGGTWLESGNNSTFHVQEIVLGNSYTTEINISETSITFKSTSDNIIYSLNLSNTPDNSREVAVGGWGGNTQWGRLTIEGEISTPVQIPSDVINIQSTGSTFAPVIEVTGSPVIEWTFDDGSTSSSVSPSKDYGSVGSRHNYLKVTPWSALVGINAGYNANNENDGGYGGFAVVPKQYISDFNNLNLAKSSLKYLCASSSPIRELDLSEMSALQFIELLFCSNLANLKLGSHPVLERLCTEDCNLAALDLSGCPELKDLRSASNNYSSIKWGTTGAKLWHICVRSSPFSQNIPALTQFPLLKELLIWNNNQTGALIIHSAVIQRIDAYNNNYTSADVSGSNTLRELNISGNKLTSLNLGFAGSLNEAFFKDCSLSQALVDYVLLTVDGNGRTAGILDLTGNAKPSDAGMVNYDKLKQKGWTVNISTSPLAVENIKAQLSKIIVSNSEVRIDLSEIYFSWKAQLYNTNGNLLATKPVEGNALSFDISGYFPGMYIIRLSKENINNFIKFVKP